MVPFIVFIICLIALIIGSYTDIKTREVPDWINYGLIFTGVGISLIFSIIKNDFYILFSSIIGLTLMFGIACLMFYTGQWGGGDSKMLMALGALIGIPIRFSVQETLYLWMQEMPFLFSFLLYAFVIGGIYGFLWSSALAVKKRKEFFADIKMRLSERSVFKIKIILLCLVILSFMVLFIADNLQIKILVFSITLTFIILYYLYFFVKSVESVCMIKMVAPERLTEGDWINKEIKVAGKYIAGPKDLGVSKQQIAKLIALKKRNKITLVEVKEGVPFVPSFLIAFLLSYFIGLGWLVVMVF